MILTKKFKKLLLYGFFLLFALLVFSALLNLKYLFREGAKKYSIDFRDEHFNRERNHRIIDSLEHQVEDLKQILNQKSQQLDEVKKLNAENENGGHINIPLSETLFADGDSILHFVNEKIQKSEVLHGSRLKNEYEVNQFTMFNSDFVYKTKSDLINKPEVTLTSSAERRRELIEVIMEGVHLLNKDTERTKVSPTYRFTSRDFLHGLYRTEKGIGTQYDLVFQPRSSRNIINKEQLFKITLFRPFASLRGIDTSTINKDEMIYFIIPLKERTESFRVFIDFFKEVAIPDKYVHLTVVYFGNEGLSEIQDILSSLEKSLGFTNYKLITFLDKFSRGRALQRGIDSITAKNPLLFFCDVDIAFTSDFLNQCRSHASPGKLVFFPILFSLYNPALVYKYQSIPSLRDRQKHKYSHGFWRDFGYGMSCQFLSDFKDIGGFDLSITGWGTEDLLLYRNYARSSNIRIVRTPVNSLFHHWHSKTCDKNWSKEQFESCLKSRIKNEGTDIQLGREYFEMKEKLKSSRNA